MHLRVSDASRRHAQIVARELREGCRFGPEDGPFREDQHHHRSRLVSFKG